MRSFEDRYGTGAVGAVAALLALGLLALVLAIVEANVLVLAITMGLTAIAILASLVVSKPAFLLVVAIILPPLGVGLALLLETRGRYLVAIAAVTIAAVWMTVGALGGRSAKGLALTLFVAFSTWSGIIAFLGELGAKDPKFTRAVVELKPPGGEEGGLYLGGGSGDVYFATNSLPHEVHQINGEDVASLRFGDEVDVRLERKQEDQGDVDDRDGGPGEDLPKPDPTKSLADGRGHLDGVPLRLELVGIGLGERLLTLQLRLRNLAQADRPDQRLTIGDGLDDGRAVGRGNVADSADGLRLTDVDGAWAYPVARDSEGRCECSEGLANVTLRPRGSELLRATFRRPDDATVYLAAPHFKPIELPPLK